MAKYLLVRRAGTVAQREQGAAPGRLQGGTEQLKVKTITTVTKTSSRRFLEELVQSLWDG